MPMEEKIFEFKNIFVEYINEDKKSNAKYVRLLDGISGTFKSGRLTAVMGASGAGKSTLFDVLLGGIDNSAKTYGTILYDGNERSEDDWIHQVSYLKQFDIFFPKFSIMESIMYNLDFYKPNLSKKEKIAFAEEILRMSNIYEKRYAYVESLSGGECKRAMIALSLCADPEIIFMDEPTSGLDSHSALTLINFMKNYAEKNNKIVVISLHQPGEALFNLFEDILYLGRGAVFYEGKLNKIEGWLEEKGLKKLQGISLAEYLFELHSNNPYPPEIAQTKPLVDQIIETNRQEYKDLREHIELKKGLSNLLVRSELSFKDMKTLWRRFYLNIWRTRHLIVTFISNTLSMGLFFVVAVLILYFLSKDFAKKHSCATGSFSEIVEALKKNMTDNGCELWILNIVFGYYLIFASYGLGYCNYDFFGDKNYMSDDILSGKYSTLTSFIANLIHDLISTTFWFATIPMVAYILPIRSLLPWTYIPLLILYSISYASVLMFLRHICGGSATVSVFLLCGILIIIDYGTTIFFDMVANINDSVLGWFKYGSYIYLFCPPVILIHILKYRRYILSREILDKSENFIDKITEKGVNATKATAFDFLRLENLPPYWTCYLILLLSIGFNILVSFYLFSGQLKTYIRLKLN